MRRLVVVLIAVCMLGATAAADPAGKELYEQVCAACHGVTGEGNGPVAFAVKPPPRNFVKDKFKAGDSPEQIFATITNGLAGTKMVGYPSFTWAQRWSLAVYVRAFRPAPAK